MAYRQRRTPGVYVTELEAFPPSVVGVQTAVPAFIGYTEKAEVSGKPVYNKPIRVSSLVDYEEFFGAGFKPVFQIDEVTPETPDDYDFKVFDSAGGDFKFYKLTQSGNQYNLYNSMRFFYANAGTYGGNAYVVSVGSYEDGPVDKDKLLEGLSAIKEQVGPTMLVIPDATLLPDDGDETTPWKSAAFQEVVRAMLLQCADLQDRVAILDVYGSQYATKTDLDNVIDQFRVDVGDKALSYGMGYFPFLDTSVVPLSDINYTNVDLETNDELKTVLTMQNDNLYVKGSPRHTAIQADIDAIAPDNTPEQVVTLNQNLTAALPLLVDIERIIVAKIDTLPPSGAMAGVFCYTDGSRGVWNAPANVTLSSVDKPTFKLNDAQQGDLNVPVDGKAVDALREFTGRGTVVWGARTLDGNSNDYRYIQVRRTLIYIEQSIKKALNQFVFAANDGNTWVTVTSMVSNFLQGVWSQGGLMGATADEAYTVECGLGSTMTAMDILEGYMIVQVTLQMIRPAEFIELTFKQKMEGIG